MTELSPWQQYKKNLGDSRPWHLLWKENYAPQNVIKMRLEICHACPEFINPTTQCKKCGCVMQLKTKLKEAECPIGKWQKIDS